MRGKFGLLSQLFLLLWLLGLFSLLAARQLTQNVKNQEIETESEESDEEDDEEDDVHYNQLIGAGIYWGTFGEIVQTESPILLEKMLVLYSREMEAKSGECHWTDQDKGKWELKLSQIKNLTLEDSKGFLELDESRAEYENMSDKAKILFGVLDHLENLTIALTTDQQYDALIFKYTTYLRERMILRRQKFGGCEWTQDDRQRAEKGVETLLDESAESILGRIFEFAKVDPADESLMTEKERKELKKEINSSKFIYLSLFESFDQD